MDRLYKKTFSFPWIFSLAFLLGLILEPEAEAQLTKKAIVAKTSAKTTKKSVREEDYSAWTQAKLSEKVESLIQKNLPNASIGILVKDAKTGKILFERKSLERFVPASTAKIMIAASALLALGERFHYETTLRVLPHSRQPGRIEGDVYVEFSGDPSLTSEDLKELFKALRRAGIREITGQVVIDNTRFQGPHYAPGWTWDSIPWHYSAPITSVILNQNRVNLTLHPGTVPGGLVQARVVGEQGSAFSVESFTRAATPLQANTSCQLLVNMDNHNHLQLGGCWPVSKDPVGLRLAVTNPDLVAKQVVTSALKINEIRLRGNVVIGHPTPKDTVVVARHQSEPLKELVKQVLTDSNNIFAESLTKTLGYHQFQHGSFKAGVRAMKKILGQSANLNVKRMKLMDGSGQSRYNLLSPRDLSQVLYLMYHHPLYNSFKEGLAVSGKTGTLRGRMSGKGMAGKVLAKTGSLEGVSALSGYLSTKNHQNLIFTIMTDRVAESTRHSKWLEAQLCQLFINYFTLHPAG